MTVPSTKSHLDLEVLGFTDFEKCIDLNVRNWEAAARLQLSERVQVAKHPGAPLEKSALFWSRPYLCVGSTFIRRIF